MSTVLATPTAAELPAVVHALRGWQEDTGSIQLHPGDVGWFWRFGAEETAAAIRTWSRDGQMLAVGLLDGDRVLRLALAPSAQDDAELAHAMADDVTHPDRGVLPAGEANVEANCAPLVHARLAAAGWGVDEPWVPLRRDLADPVEDAGIHVDPVGADRATDRTAVHRAAFGGQTFTDERWHAMASGSAYADARCLLARDDAGATVGGITVWSAGPGRPGLIEPLGVHPDHRGHGYGRSLTLAAAGALRDMGASSACVLTPSSLTGAVATYVSAGFDRLPQVHDRRRPG